MLSTDDNVTPGPSERQRHGVLTLVKKEPGRTMEEHVIKHSRSMEEHVIKHSRSRAEQTVSQF